MNVKLTIYDDEREYFSQKIKLPCVVGRSKQCNIAIVHPLISRQHCEIYAENDVVKARDLGSLNGTFFRGERIGRGVEIPLGDAFSIGALYFLIESSSQLTATHSAYRAASTLEETIQAPTGNSPRTPGSPETLDSDDFLLSSKSNDDDLLKLVDAPPASAEQVEADSDVLDLAQILDDESNER